MISSSAAFTASSSEDQQHKDTSSTNFLKSNNFPSVASSSAPSSFNYSHSDDASSALKSSNIPTSDPTPIKLAKIQPHTEMSSSSIETSSSASSQQPVFASTLSSSMNNNAASSSATTCTFSSSLSNYLIPSEGTPPLPLKRESLFVSPSITPQTPSKKRTFTEKEIEDLDAKYKQELAEMMQEEEPLTSTTPPKKDSHTNGIEWSESDEPILSVTQETPQVFMKSLSGMARVFYAQILRHEEKIESLTKANRKYQEVIKKKSEKISLLQHQLSTMVKQIEKYEQSLRQRVSASPQIVTPSQPVASLPPPISSSSSKSASSSSSVDATTTTSSLEEPLPPILAPKPKKRKTEGESSETKIVKSRSNVVFKVKPADCVNYNGATYILARAFEDKYKLKKMLHSYQAQTGENPQLFLRDEEFKKLKAENPDNLSVFAYRTSLYTMEFVNFYISNQ